MNAQEFLETARNIMEERGKEYDQPGGERDMEKIVAAFNTITGQDLTVQEGWFFMIALKAVRLFSNPTKPHQDSLVDGIAYYALLAEAMTQNHSAKSTKNAEPKEAPEPKEAVSTRVTNLVMAKYK